jgi:diguanylate cyclase (GGDEF)-like protein
LNKRTSKEYTLIILSLIGALSISPFAVIRFLQAEYIIAIVDLCIAIGMTATCLFVIKTHRLKIPSILLAIISVASALLSIKVKGISQVYWAYPAMVAAYYLLQPKLAVVINLIMLLILVPILYPLTDHIIFSAILITLLITNMFAYIFSQNVERQHQQLTLLATKDALTGTGNRRALDIKLSNLVLANKRKPETVSLILFDLDYFKKVNDRFGHLVGDEALIKVSQIVQDSIRSTDALFRYGGEEFVIVPLSIDLKSAADLAEKIRSLIEKADFNPQFKLTVSFGVAEYKNNESYESWLSRADKALYNAKNQGRNRVCVATDLD